MDPVTQGALGAAAAIAFVKKDHLRIAALSGWAGGMLADADVLIRSDSDPLLFIEYHRHFTHSLAFIPIGGLVCAAFLWAFLRSRFRFATLYAYSTIGYATHGLLDACTSYGTRLLWPFSETRVAWNIISVIDPLVTLPLLAGIVFAFWKVRAAFARVGLGLAIGVLLLGVYQRERAEAALVHLAGERGHHAASRLTVKPSMGNLILWRGIYLHDGRYYIDAARVAPFSGATIIPGSSMPAIDARSHAFGIPSNSRLADDIRRFDHFSDRYLAWHPEVPDALCDARYAILPNSLLPLWGIRVDPAKPDEHASFENFRQLDEQTMRRYRRLLFSGQTD